MGLGQRLKEVIETARHEAEIKEKYRSMWIEEWLAEREQLWSEILAPLHSALLDAGILATLRRHNNGVNLSVYFKNWHMFIDVVADLDRQELRWCERDEPDNFMSLPLAMDWWATRAVAFARRAASQPLADEIAGMPGRKER